MSDGNRPQEEGRIRSIRGLNDDLYREFSAKARELGVSVGELMNVGDEQAAGLHGRGHERGA
jgi:hypothetical protein